MIFIEKTNDNKKYNKEKFFEWNFEKKARIR
jgi:hypothetical protein